ncbi:MAG TPA: stage III sporulation protein AF, partial [Pseudogracilibacillus sp.]|nr:stage III sporulation protein AF [Pseudogracilibacillus sp.]
MDALVNWVTQIIMFILLASIIDLLTPESAMKKYIKLVVGLLLILILMQPIFSLFNHSVESALHKTFTEINNKTETDQSIENLINLQKD